MNLYWLYDLPNCLFATVTVGFFTGLGIVGLFATRSWVGRLHKVDHSHNDIVGYFMSAVTVFYGITLGLVAVGTWTTFSQVEDKVDAEAQTVASIYRDAGTYEEPWRTEIRTDMRDYVRYVIDVSWPQQRKGIIPTGSGKYLDSLQAHLSSFNPQTMSQDILQAEVFRQYNVLVQNRRARLNAVTTGLPGSLWALVILGSIISIVVTWFFDARSFGLHLSMVILMSVLLGLLIFLIGTLDNPFRGQVAVGPDALEVAYSQLMSVSSR